MENKMSLCRWSSMDMMCNLYVYEACDGYSINVAKNRAVWLEELPPPVSFGEDGWLDRHTKMLKMKREYVPIVLPYDGQSFSCDSTEDAINVLTMLKDVGYNAPYDELFEMLKC
jgi:hypothetical protein